MKKTIHIKDLIAEVNFKNQHSTCSDDIRTGWNALLESFLFQNDVYAGYNEYTERQLEPGIAPSETRKYFYTSKKLTN